MSFQLSAKTSRLVREISCYLKDMLVGLGRLELPTSPLSGVRSNHLSYRPVLWVAYAPGSVNTGGAGRDRTGDLLNANQALSQLSYSPLSLSADRLWLTAES